MNNVLLFLGLGGNEVIIVVFVILLLFGGRKIPELMRGLGQGMKEFKKATNDDKTAEGETENEIEKE